MKLKLKRKETLKKHTSFKIGGPADYFCVVTTIDELDQALVWAKKKCCKTFILGAGSNLLISDKGFRGLVINVAFDWIEYKGNLVRVGAGVLLSKLIKQLADQGLAGLEFLAGVPGSVGGAAVMNAGAWDNNIGKFVEGVFVVDKNGQGHILKHKELKFKYRKSVLQSGSLAVVEVILKLRKGKKDRIRAKIKKNLAKRRDKQPLNLPSCGSVFKNPQGKHAGYLIEQAGLRGLRIGDAEVSKKHGNFIVNLGKAKASDVLKLITVIQKRVKPKLKPEVKLVCS